MIPAVCLDTANNIWKGEKQSEGRERMWIRGMSGSWSFPTRGPIFWRKDWNCARDGGNVPMAWGLDLGQSKGTRTEGLWAEKH